VRYMEYSNSAGPDLAQLNKALVAALAIWSSGPFPCSAARFLEFFSLPNKSAAAAHGGLVTAPASPRPLTPPVAGPGSGDLVRRPRLRRPRPPAGLRRPRLPWPSDPRHLQLRHWPAAPDSATLGCGHHVGSCIPRRLLFSRES
jgi:hypothetical protein